MEVKKRLYTVDDVWEIQRQPCNSDKKYELIHGDLVEMPPSNYPHGRLAGRIFRYFEDYAESRQLGEASVEVGFYPASDRTILLAPDVAFITAGRLPDSNDYSFVGFMPDLAVEIVSPSNTRAELNRKATILLDNGTRLVWIVNPMHGTAEVLRSTDEGKIERKIVGIDGILSGEDVLPGFELAVRDLLPAQFEQR